MEGFWYGAGVGFLFGAWVVAVLAHFAFRGGRYDDE